MISKEKIIDQLFNEFKNIRYAAIYKNNELLFKQKQQVTNSSEATTDKFEELLVNPTLLTLAKQRGDIDCGGLNYIIVGYRNFYQFVQKINNGHLSICLALETDLNKLPKQIINFLSVEFPELYK